jgi:hypothetical protein
LAQCQRGVPLLLQHSDGSESIGSNPHKHKLKILNGSEATPQHSSSGQWCSICSAGACGSEQWPHHTTLTSMVEQSVAQINNLANGAAHAQLARAAQNSGRITLPSLQWWSSPWFRY